MGVYRFCFGLLFDSLCLMKRFGRWWVVLCCLDYLMLFLVIGGSFGIGCWVTKIEVGDVFIM